MNKKEGKSGGGCVAASPIRDGITLVVVCTPRVFLFRLWPRTVWKGDCPALPPLAEQDDLAQPRVGLLWFAWILMEGPEEANRLAPGVMPMISPLRSARPYAPQRTQQLSTSPPPCPLRDFRMMLHVVMFFERDYFSKTTRMMSSGPSGPRVPRGETRRPVQEAARRGRHGTIATIIIIISSSCRSWVGSFA